MKLTATELAYIRPLGLYITQKCDACAKLLNQTVLYTIMDKPEVYCTAVCRDTAFFGDVRQARKHSTPGKCIYCGGDLKGKRRGALFCDEICKKRLARKRGHNSTAEVQLSGTPTQSNQRVVDTKTAVQGNRIAGVPKRLKSTLDEASAKFGAPVEVEQRISGSSSS